MQRTRAVLVAALLITVSLTVAGCGGEAESGYAGDSIWDSRRSEVPDALGTQGGVGSRTGGDFWSRRATALDEGTDQPSWMQASDTLDGGLTSLTGDTLGDDLANSDFVDDRISGCASNSELGTLDISAASDPTGDPMVDDAALDAELGGDPMLDDMALDTLGMPGSC